MIQLPLILALAALAIGGCTSTKDYARATAAAEASKAGCLCIARKCNTVISASGQAALGAEATQMTRQVTRELSLPTQ